MAVAAQLLAVGGILVDLVGARFADVDAARTVDGQAARIHRAEPEQLLPGAFGQAVLQCHRAHRPAAGDRVQAIEPAAARGQAAWPGERQGGQDLPPLAGMHGDDIHRLGPLFEPVLLLLHQPSALGDEHRGRAAVPPGRHGGDMSIGGIAVLAHRPRAGAEILAIGAVDVAAAVGGVAPHRLPVGAGAGSAARAAGREQAQELRHALQLAQIRHHRDWRGQLPR